MEGRRYGPSADPARYCVSSPRAFGRLQCALAQNKVYMSECIIYISRIPPVTIPPSFLLISSAMPCAALRSSVSPLPFLPSDRGAPGRPIQRFISGPPAADIGASDGSGPAGVGAGGQLVGGGPDIDTRHPAAPSPAPSLRRRSRADDAISPTTPPRTPVEYNERQTVQVEGA